MTEQIEAVEEIEVTEVSNEKTDKYSNRKSFAFSDEAMFNEVDEIFKQKPEGLTNAEFLHQALKLYVEAEEMQQSFNHLPTSVVDIFKGDLEKLNVAFETIREVYKTQMTTSTQLIQQREERLTRQYTREHQLLEQQLERVMQELQQAEAQKTEALEKVKELVPLKEELTQSKGTISTLQQALMSEQERVAGLQRELSRCNVEEFESLKKSYADLKELFATNNIRAQHLESQLAQQQELLNREREQSQQQHEISQQNEQALKDELKKVREELSVANKTVQDLYQKLLKA